jgi:hypothetical protein
VVVFPPPAGSLAGQQPRGDAHDAGEVRPPFRAFRLVDGRYSKIDVPGPVSTLPLGQNDRGQVVGLFDDADNRRHGFLLEGGRYTTIDIPGVVASGVSGINDRGQLVGVYLDGNGSPHGYLLDRGVCTSIEVPGASGTQVNAINDRGQIVGIWEGPGAKIHGFLLENGKFTAIDAPAPRRAPQPPASTTEGRSSASVTWPPRPRVSATAPCFQLRTAHMCG